MFSLQQNWRTRGQNRSCLEVREGEGVKGVRQGTGGEVAHTMYTHMNKSENNKKEDLFRVMEEHKISKLS
jgi:hypothetical protein